MSDAWKKAKAEELPGNKGQFGSNNATEDHKSLPDHDSGGAPVAPEPDKESGSSGKPGPHQVQGGMRS